MPYIQLVYHLVWATKLRQPIITSDLEPRLYGYLKSQAQRYEARLYAIGGIEDHIHIVTTIPPKIAVAKFVADIKGSSSHFVNTSLPDFAPFYWQSEYGALSVGASQLKATIDYVRRQREHHTNDRTLPFLEL